MLSRAKHLNTRPTKTHAATNISDPATAHDGGAIIWPRGNSGSREARRHSLPVYALPVSAWGIGEHAMHQLPGCRSAAGAVRELPLRAGLKRCGGAGTLPYPCHSERSEASKRLPNQSSTASPKPHPIPCHAEQSEASRIPPNQNSAKPPSPCPIPPRA